MNSWLGIFTLLFGLITASAQSQNLYRSQSGTLMVQGTVGDSVVSLINSEIHVVLDYETTEFSLSIPIDEFRSENGSFDVRLETKNGQALQLSGKIDLDYINTGKHPPQHVFVELFADQTTLNENAVGEAEIEHLNGGLYSCLLSMKFTIPVEKLVLPEDLSIEGPDVFVQLKQTLLNREQD